MGWPEFLVTFVIALMLTVLIYAAVIIARERGSRPRQRRNSEQIRLEMQKVERELVENELAFFHTLRSQGIQGRPVAYLLDETKAGCLIWTRMPADGTICVDYRVIIGDCIEVQCGKSDHNAVCTGSEYDLPITSYNLLFTDGRVFERFDRYWDFYMEHFYPDKETDRIGDPRIRELFDLLEAKKPVNQPSA